MNKKMSRGFNIGTTHNTPRRRKRHIRHTALETIDGVYNFMTELPKKKFNFLQEVIHPNDRIKIPFRRLESTCQVINHRFHSKHGWGVNSPSPRIRYHRKSARRQNSRQRYPFQNFTNSKMMSKVQVPSRRISKLCFSNRNIKSTRETKCTRKNHKENATIMPLIFPKRVSLVPRQCWVLENTRSTVWQMELHGDFDDHLTIVGQTEDGYLYLATMSWRHKASCSCKNL